MNITHSTTEKVTGDMLEAIFQRQRELMVKYHHIEEKSGLMQTTDFPVNLDDRFGQARIKDFAWRIMEELGEALDARREEKQEHFQEELIDALHFLTELTLLVGVTPQELTPHSLGDKLSWLYHEGFDEYGFRSISDQVCRFTENLAMMCNTLKNKPWKVTMMLTDRGEFHNRLREAWTNYMGILSLAGLTTIEICDIYLKKSQVNQFRQRSNY